MHPWNETLYSIKNRKNLKYLEDLVSLQNQVEELRQQHNLGKQNFHENIKKIIWTTYWYK